MKFPDPKLRLPIALLIGSLLIGGGIFHHSLNARLVAEERLIKERQLADATALAVREAPTRLAQDRAAANLHSRIRHSGFIGEEDRAGWITALARSKTLLQLNSLAWHLSPRSESSLAADLKVSKMEFSATPVTPDSLARLLAHLRASAPGRFTVEHCSLTLATQSTSGQATCRLNWWTLTEDAP
jgi:hypothetical protein